MDKLGILVVVSGFSGAGKGTLMKKLLAKHANYALSVSMTTRSARRGEMDGREYFFVTREQFEDSIRAGELLEYAEYVNNYYGTPLKYVEDKLLAGKDVLLEIEIQGALKVKEKYPQALLLFVMPPSIAELRRRLSKRGSENAESKRRRLMRAREEAKGIEDYEYLVINDDLDVCSEQIHALIDAARYAPHRNTAFIKGLREELGTESE